MIRGFRQRKYKVSLEYPVRTECKEGLEKRWEHVERPARRCADGHSGTAEQQNK